MNETPFDTPPALLGVPDPLLKTEKVEAYRSKDGNLYNTEAAAIRHNIRAEIEQAACDSDSKWNWSPVYGLELSVKMKLLDCLFTNLEYLVPLLRRYPTKAENP